MLYSGYSFQEMVKYCEMSISEGLFYPYFDRVSPENFGPSYKKRFFLYEGLYFLSYSRTHVKEGIINPDEDDPIQYGIKIPFTTNCVLVLLSFQFVFLNMTW
jgi:hypothetical protein